VIESVLDGRDQIVLAARGPDDDANIGQLSDRGPAAFQIRHHGLDIGFGHGRDPQIQKVLEYDNTISGC
jgi:hypothetical protein